MKPWEKVWTARPAYGGWVLVNGTYPNEVPDAVEMGEADARLCAAAPAMARLLVELEWDEKEDSAGNHTHTECNICGGLMPDGYYKNATGHSPDCGLVRTLRAAGVIE